MATSGGGERQGLGQYVKSQTKYGTATRLLPKTSSFFKHKISENDTLIGISLRYSVTVEEIKRENKMWTNDSLFLREHLLIPLTQQNTGNIPDGCEIVTNESAQKPNNGPSLIKAKSVDAVSETVNPSEHILSSPMDDAKDLLSKFDSSFEKLKSDVKKMEANSSDPDHHCPEPTVTGSYHNVGMNQQSHPDVTDC
ncbi:hypothetical protein ScPMuIL_002473 [Solemya velum]